MMARKLEVSLPTPNQIQMIRTFDAPRRLVIKAMTEPALIKRWLGGVRATVESAEVDFRVGGRYRYVFRLPDGGGFTFSGTYREVSDDRIVHSEAFNDDPNEALITTTLVERGGTTTLTILMELGSQQMRDAIVATGMSDGAGESYDQLEALLAGL